MTSSAYQDPGPLGRPDAAPAAVDASRQGAGDGRCPDLLRRKRAFSKPGPWYGRQYPNPPGGNCMGREARIGLLLGATACLLAVMIDWVIEELG